MIKAAVSKAKSKIDGTVKDARERKRLVAEFKAACQSGKDVEKNLVALIRQYGAHPAVAKTIFKEIAVGQRGTCATSFQSLAVAGLMAKTDPALAPLRPEIVKRIIECSADHVVKFGYPVTIAGLMNQAYLKDDSGFAARKCAVELINRSQTEHGIDYAARPAVGFFPKGDKNIDERIKSVIARSKTPAGIPIEPLTIK